MAGIVLSGRYQVIDPTFDKDEKWFKARDLTLHRMVSIWKWPSAFNPKDIEPFVALSEPGLLHILDALLNEDSVYVISKDIRGLPLSTYRERGGLDLAGMVKIIDSLTSLIRAIHQKGWVLTTLNAQDVYVDDAFIPTVTYARFQRSPSELTSLDAIGRFILEISFMLDVEVDQNDPCLMELRRAAEQARASSRWKAPYRSFDEFADDCKRILNVLAGSRPGEYPVDFAAENSSLENAPAAFPVQHEPNGLHQADKEVSLQGGKRLQIFTLANGVAAVAFLTIAAFTVWLRHTDAPHPVPHALAVAQAETTEKTNSNAMPSLTGQDARTIYAKMTQEGVPAANLSLKPERSEKSGGTIVSQLPAAGEEFDPKTTPVQIVVAVPDGESLVPNVQSMGIDRAGKLLIDQGLHYEYTIDRTGGISGTVADQNFAPGQVVPRGTKVLLHVWR